MFRKYDEEKSYLQFCRERGVSGAILCGIKRDDPNLKELMKSDFPMVLIDIPYLTDNVGSVVVDNEKYSYLAVKSLIESGRKKIGLINGNEGAYVSMERKSGYICALNDFKFDIDESIIKNGDFSADIAKDCAIELINKGVDAIFCASDLMAMGAVAAAKENNINIPKELSIFGFDGINMVDYITPTLSTVKQNSYDKGYKASGLLIDYLNKNIPMRILKSECEIYEQESTLKKK
ncbi:substrate-binding domain-containing protein [[Clostridium] dakarense]|uniref:substrate-binding domain-containing protein n=1 Tax=Faecalimicrobium dakarense TaxID=1301100 RepID=UPI001FA73375|nr:substrate-binding domain-containing protein [[Clostridium] dakarense]